MIQKTHVMPRWAVDEEGILYRPHVLKALMIWVSTIQYLRNVQLGDFLGLCIVFRECLECVKLVAEQFPSGGFQVSGKVGSAGHLLTDEHPSQATL